MLLLDWSHALGFTEFWSKANPRQPADASVMQGEWDDPARKSALTTASEMIAEFGNHAELVAGERMEIALQEDDQEGFDEWCLVAKAIAFLTRQNPQDCQPDALDGVRSPAMKSPLSNSRLII